MELFSIGLTAAVVFQCADHRREDLWRWETEWNLPTENSSIAAAAVVAAMPRPTRAVSADCRPGIASMMSDPSCPLLIFYFFKFKYT